MIRENQKYFNVLLVVIDMVVITFSLVVTWYFLLGSNFIVWGSINGLLLYYLMAQLLFVLPTYLILYRTFGLYQPQRTKSLTSEVTQIIKVNIVGFLAFTTFLFSLGFTSYPRPLTIVFFAFCLLFATYERVGTRLSLRIIRSRGYNVKHVLVMGAGPLGVKFALRVKNNSHVGYNIVGFLDDEVRPGAKIMQSPVLGKIKDLEKLILNSHVDRVIITESATSFKLTDIVDICERHGVKAEIIPSFSEYFPAKPYIDMIEDVPLIDLRYVPLDNAFKRAMKRMFDVVLAVLGIIFTSPIMFGTAVMVKLTSPGPFIYKQERIGLNKRNFNMYKFRSMKVQDNDEEEILFTTKDDPRITMIGSFIRRTSIDELPQFFNVLKGDMSLIGPRPERPVLVERFREEVPKYMVKHYVRPGMTGWAQVNGWRGNTSIKKRIEHDIYYVENWTFFLDVKIFFMTFLKGFVNENAY